MKNMMNICSTLSIAAIMVTSGLGSVYAQSGVVIIPLSGDDLDPLSNIITVAKEHGDFENPVDAVDSITDASDVNPYLVFIAPGVYTLTAPLQMKSHVHISGSGPQATRLTGAFSTSSANTSATVLGPGDASQDSSTLRGLTIINTGGGSNSIGIYNYDSSPVLKNLVVAAYGGQNNYGIYNTSASSPSMEKVTTDAIGGAASYGIYNDTSSPSMIHVSSSAEDATSTNYGIYTNVGAIRTHSVTAMASGGEFGYGIYHAGSVNLDHVIATGSGSKLGNGVRLFNNDTTSFTSSIRNSTASGSHEGLSAAGALVTLRVSHSTISDGVSGNATKTCVASGNGDGTELTSNCGI